MSIALYICSSSTCKALHPTHLHQESEQNLSLELWRDWSDSSAFALHIANLGVISGIPYSPLSHLGVMPKCKASSLL